MSGISGKFVTLLHAIRVRSMCMSLLSVTSKKAIFDAWQKKVCQFQMSLYAINTKSECLTRFDDAVADALELDLRAGTLSQFLKRLNSAY